MKMHKNISIALLLLSAVTTALAQGGNGPVYGAAMTVENPLVLRYASVVPCNVQVQLTDGSTQAWTTRVENNKLTMVDGLFGQAAVTFQMSTADIQQVYNFVHAGKLAFGDKMTMIGIYANDGQKPLQAAPTGPQVTGLVLTPLEEQLMQIGRFSTKIRWLFHKVQLAPNQAIKMFWGLQIRILTMIVDKFTEHLVNTLWDGVDGELDRGQVDIFPGGSLDLTVNVVGIHLMFKDEDTGAYTTMLDGIKKRLTAEMTDVGEYPPDQQATRKQAIQKRLDVVQTLMDLIQAS